MSEFQGGDIAKLAVAVAAVMGIVKNIEKTGYSDHGSYAYASDADLLIRLQPAMAKQGLTLMPVDIQKTVESGQTARGKPNRIAEVTVTYLLLHKGGGWVRLQTPGSGMDMGDKAVYKAMTGAFKYVLRQTFAVPTGEDPEGESLEMGPEWTSSEQGGFFAKLKELEEPPTYEQLATWCSAKGRLRPSEMTQDQRTTMLKWLEDGGSQRVREWMPEA